MSTYRPKSSAMINIHLDDTLIGKAAIEASQKKQFPLETATLMSIAIASHAASMTYKINYGDDGVLPIGIYALGEQPPGSAKTGTMGFFQDGFHSAIHDINEKRKAKRKQIEKSEKDKKGDLAEAEEETLAANQHLKVPISDATPEALDSYLCTSNGWFSAQSSEKALINTLIGGMYSDKGSSNNQDGLLMGFNGERGSALRVSRSAYTGNRHGGVAVISQFGTIDRVISASDGSGLCERFLMVSEGSMMGYRDSSKYALKTAHKQDYKNMVKSIMLRSMSNNSLDLDDLISLNIAPDAYAALMEQMDMIEPEFRQGGKYCAEILMGMWSKMSFQAMKVAATIHLMEGYDEKKAIDLPTMNKAIIVVKELLNGVAIICEEKGVIGKSAEEESAEDYLRKNALGQGKTMRSIQAALCQRKQFSQYGLQKREKVQETIDMLVNKNLVDKVVTGAGERERITYRYRG